MALSYVVRPEVRATLEHCFDGGANPVVVCGPPGCGKSAVVREWAEQQDECVFVVPLVDTTDLAALTDRVAACVGPVEGVDGLTHLLRSIGSAVVVLDDCDRLVEVVSGQLAKWRDAAPRVRWVVTSRQRLVLDGAEFVEVGPMTMDQAVTLFAARAEAARPGFRIDDDLRPVVEQLVDELDRIPLAVELAAARINTLGPAEILKRLPERFRILRGPTGALHSTIALSWDLLDPWERSVLSQCTVFRGGFSMDAAEAVVSLPDDAPWTVDVLGGLVKKSLLRSLEPADLVGEVRFELLASIREFVAARGELAPELGVRHGRWMLEHCLLWTHQMRRLGGEHARARLELEQDNLLAAFHAATDPVAIVDLALVLDKSFRLQGAHASWEEVLRRAVEVCEQVDPTRTARVHRALGELHMLRGRLAEASASLASAAERAADDHQFVALAWTQFLRGELARRRGELAEALAYLEEAVELGREHGVEHVERMALGHKAGCYVDVGELDAARESISAMERLAPSDDLRDEANLLKRVAYAQYYLGNVDEQRRLTSEALRLARAGGDRRLQAICVQGLGDAAFALGDYDAALESYVEALALHQALGSVELEGALLGNLGSLQHRLDRLQQARTTYRQALSLHASTGAKPYEAVVWFGLGVLEFEQGHLEDAATALLRAAELNDEICNESDVGSCKLVAAWAASKLGEDAGALLAEARRAFEASGDGDWVALVDYTAHGTALPDDAGETVTACALALAGGAVVDRSRLHVRAALARAGQASPAARPVELRIASDASWFETPQGRVDLRRRRAPRFILAALLEQRGRDAIDVYEAFETGWPNEVATPEAAADRVYWAIRTLRKLGLEDILITNDEGYLLDPDCSISVG